MRYIREVSDIHLDHDRGRRLQIWTPPSMREDHDTCLVLAGDLWTAGKLTVPLNRLDTVGVYSDDVSWIELVSRRFKYVVVVLGNHDYWHGNLTFEVDRLRNELKRLGVANVFVLERTTIVLDQVKFVGGTLWTNMKNGDPLVKLNFRLTMSADCQYIKQQSDYRKLNEHVIIEKHVATADYIFKHARRDSPEQVVVVVTHMAPSYSSVNEMYRNPSDELANYYYFSDLDQKILDNGQIDLWFHGHTHCPADYLVGNTRVVNNARGYAVSESTDYDPCWRIDLEREHQQEGQEAASSL